MSACRPTVVMSSSRRRWVSSSDGGSGAALPVDRQRTTQEVLHPVCRVQRAEGVLENHLELRAECPRGLETVAREDVDAVEQDGTGARLLEPGNAAGQGALAAIRTPRPVRRSRRGQWSRSTPCRARTACRENRPPMGNDLPSPRTSRAGIRVGNVCPGCRLYSVAHRAAPPRTAASASAPNGATRWPGAASARSGMFRNFTPSGSPVSGTRGPVSGGNAPMSACV